MQDMATRPDVEQLAWRALLSCFEQDEQSPTGWTKRDLATEEERVEWWESHLDLARELAARPDELHQFATPELADVLGVLMPQLAQVANEEPDVVLWNSGVQERLQEVESEWTSRVWDLVPIGLLSLPRKETQEVFGEAVRAYLFGLDLACVGIARAALEVLTRELHETECWERKVFAAFPVSAWARDDLERRRREAREAEKDERSGKRGRVKKDPERVSLFWCIEDLAAAGVLEDPEAAAAHEIRVAGNDAVHRGEASCIVALDVLKHLRTVLKVFA
jgi:hypothetical protein